MDKNQTGNLQELIQLFENGSPPEKDSRMQVSIPASIQMDTALFAQSKEGLVPITARAYHDHVNLNGSAIEPENFKKNTESAEFRPILASVVETDDGYDFGGHDMEFLDNGEIQYIEKQVGVLTGAIGFEFDEQMGVTRAVLHGYLYEGYNDQAISILRNRGGNVDCSVELNVNSQHFDSNADVLVIDDYYIAGLTLLGAKHTPGMEGSYVCLDFEDEKVPQPDDELIQRIERLEALLAPTSDSEKKGEKSMATITYTMDEKTYSLDLETQTSKVFDSVMSKVAAQNLNYWYVETREDFAVLIDCETKDYMRQKYALEDDQVVLEGDFERIEHCWLSKDELAEKDQQLQSLQETYETCKAELDKYKLAEARVQKEEFMHQERFAQCQESEAFKKLAADMDSYSFEDFCIQCKLAYADYMLAQNEKDKSEKLEPKGFALNLKNLEEENEKRSPYGGLFK